MRPVSPASLVDNQIKVIKSSSLPYPALVEKRFGSQFAIKIDVEQVNSMASKIKIDPDIVFLGLTYHEVAHIKYGSFNLSNYANNLEMWIDNLVEDARIEYQMSFDYPYVAKFIGLTLATQKKEVVEKFELGQEKDLAESEVTKMTNWLWDLVRFNYIPDNIDEDFISFVFPRVLLAKRSNRQKSSKLSQEIASYINFKCSKSKDKGFNNQYDVVKIEDDNSNNSEKNQTDDDNDENQVEKKERDEKVHEKVNDLASQAKEIFEKFKAAGIEEAIGDVVEGNDYFRTVVSRNSDQVNKVYKAFKEIFSHVQHDPAKEGDINIKRVQEAYMNDLVGEEGSNYYAMKKTRAKFDCFVIRDTSGSTDVFKSKYAKATCILAKALDELDGVRLSVVDFNSEATVTKSFDCDLSKAKIYPVAIGGTDMVSALSAVKNMDFKNDLRIGVVLTDGWCRRGVETPKAMVENYFSDVIWIPIYLGYDTFGTGYVKSIFGDVEAVVNIDDLYKAVANLIKRGVEA